MFSWLGKKQKQVAARDEAATPDVPAAAAASDERAEADGHGLAANEGPSLAAGSDLNVDALLAPPASSSAGDSSSIGPTDAARTEALTPAVVGAISTVFDPEIPVNIYELGLIYEIAVDAGNQVGVKMTLTSPACPSAQQIPSEVRYKVKALEGVADCQVEIVWEPPWTKDMMSETAKLSLGMY